MRKLYAFLFTAFFLVSASTVFSQVSNYTYSQTNGTYSAISGGTLLGTTSSDDEQFVDPAAPAGSTAIFTGPGFPIGFNFTYNGIVFDRVAIENNGWISLGQSALTPSVDINTTSQYTPLSSTFAHTTAQFRNRIAGMGRDIQAQAGSSLRIQTIGSAPNRQCVIQYAGYKRFGTAGTGDNFSFQIILNETSNTVQVVYGSVVLNNTTTTSSINHVGLGGTAAADFNNRQTVAPHNWNTTIAGTTNAQGTQNPTSTIAVTAPVSGLTMTWTPAAPCSGVPSPGLITGPSAVICSGGNATLTLSGYTVAPGITFQWNQSSTPGGPYTPIPGATNTTYTFTTNTTAYFTCTVTCTASGLSSNTTQFTVNVNKPVHSNVLATPSTTCSPGSSVITGTVSGGITTGGSGVIATSGTINLAIPDNSPAGVNTTLTIPATTFANAADLKIRLTLSHSWSGDVIAKLTSPCGTTFVFDRLGVPVSTVGNSDNFGTNNTTTPPAAVYTFDLAGATVLPETTGGSGFIAAGTYKPSDVNGASHNWAGFTFPCNGGGTWTLNLSDNAGLDVGSLAEWAIIGPASANYTHTLTGPGTIVQNPPTGPNNSNASFNVSNLPAGVHNFTLTSTDVTGCSVSSPVSVTVNATPVVTITPAAPVICAGTIQQLTFNVTPPVTQAFSSGTINLAIPDNNATGVTTAPIAIPAGVNIPSANNLRVRINANHTWVGDLIFRLTSPCGTTFLFDRPGVPVSTVGNSDNLGTASGTTPPPGVYLFDLAAATIIPETNVGTGFIAPGSYKPSNTAGTAHNWTGLTFPCAATGNWTLTISDNAGGDVGTLVDWAILYDASNPVVVTPITNVFTDAAAGTAYVAGTPVTTVWVKPTTTTTYTATATVAGCTSAANVTVTVNQLPAITGHPTSLPAPICPGFNVTYTVAATGAGLTYQWQVSTDGGTTFNNIINNPPYSGATTSSLVITNVTTAMNNYRYRVVVSGTCPPSVTSNAATLLVATAPVITTNPANVTICAGANASFTVAATGTPAPTIYQWQVSTDGGATWTNLTTGGSFTPTFTITAATTALNNNRYRCIVTNSCGQSVTSTAATLVVNAVPAVSVGSLASTRICLSDTLIPLAGAPVGGSWSGTGVSGFNFIPGSTAVGTYTLTYSYTNSLGCTGTASTIAKVEDCPERQRLLRDDGVLLYPNPNNGRFFIKMNSTLYNYVGVKVYNMAGQLVNGSVVNDAVSSPVYSGLVYGRVTPIDISYLPAGTYMVKVYYDDGARTSEKAFTVVISR